LIRVLGDKQLDQITTEDVQHLKSALEHRSAKTVNNVLAVLSVLLRTAVEWDGITRVPCTIRLLRTATTTASFYDYAEYERLVDAARGDQQAYLVALLGGEAGLRCGEMMALEWTDVDMNTRQLCVTRSDWNGHVMVPTGGPIRYVPLTKRLTEALRQARHLRRTRVLSHARGQALTQKVIQVTMRRAARGANVKTGVHILRHTSCSHLAMRGAPARAIQAAAGPQDLQTTQRYMHLSPAALDAAIRL
jgi:integrase